MSAPPSPTRSRRRTAGTLVLAAAVVAGSMVPLAANASGADDPREGLAPGFNDAGTASSNVEKLSSQNLPAGAFVHSDMGFGPDDLLVTGDFNGFSIYDSSDAADPELISWTACPGSQNDVSVYGDLLFLSVEQSSARIDCTTGDVTNANRMRGIRIFDISNPELPTQVAVVQTCRGSHTHTIVGEQDGDLYIYGSGTASNRSALDVGMGRCAPPTSSLANPNTPFFAIDVIRVPLDDPAAAEWVDNARVMSTCGSSACESEHAAGALNNFPPANPQATFSPPDLRAPGGQSASQTSACHDITAYPELDLAAGACQGNGFLMDVSDKANPVRIDAVSDPNFAYWHSATFNNDGTKVVFTDEWGGGIQARCTPTYTSQGVTRPTPDNWGANALFDIVQTESGPEMRLASYYKIPNNQSSLENCVAHNGNLVPVPGRDIMVQAWYQGGLSVFDFTDTANPVEIGFFDRGPIVPTEADGFWSVYWNNGAIFGTEIGRGLDTFSLAESEHLNEVELEAAAQVATDGSNPQNQQEIVWPASFTTVRAWQSAANRQDELAPDVDANLTKFVDRAERFTTGPQARAAVANLRAVENQLGDSRVETGLGEALLELADELG